MEENISDTINPAEESSSQAIELPEGLNLVELQNQAIKWNAEWKTVFNVRKTRWEENYRLFRHFEQGTSENISTKVYEVWSNIQTEIPHIVNSIFTKSEIVKPIPKFLDPSKKALRIQEYINKMILVANQGRKDATDAVQDFLVYGTVFAKTFWDNELKAEFDIRPTILDPASGMEIPNPTVQQWVPKYEGKPAFRNVDIFEFALDPNFRGHNVNEARWVRERIFLTKEEIKKLIQNGEVIDIPDSDLSNNGEGVETGQEIRDRIDGINTKPFNKKIYVDEFWTEWFWNENGVQKSGKFYFWLLNNDRIIKFKANTFNRVPYLVSRCYRLSNSFYGVGDVDVMSSLATHMNVVHDQGGQLAKQTGSKLTLYTSAAGVDGQMLKMKTNGILKVKDMNAIRTEDTTAGNDLGTLINYKNSLKSDLSSAVGINDVLRGEDPGDVTATQISILNSNSSARLALKLQNFQDEYIVPLASNFYNLSKQFIDTYALIMDNTVIQLSQQDFVGDYDWVPQGSIAQANKNLRIKQLTDLSAQISQSVMMAAQSNGMIQVKPFNQGLFYENEILPMYEIQNPEQYFIQPDETSAPNVPIMPQSGAPTPGVDNSMPVPSSMPISQNPIDTGNLEGNIQGPAESVIS